MTATELETRLNELGLSLKDEWTFAAVVGLAFNKADGRQILADRRRKVLLAELADLNRADLDRQHAACCSCSVPV